MIYSLNAISVSLLALLLLKTTPTHRSAIGISDYHLKWAYARLASAMR